MRIAAGFFVAALMASALFAQEPKIFRLGMTENRVDAVFGLPQFWYADGQHFRVFPRLTEGLPRPGYWRHLRGAIYDVRVYYDIDPDGSRLNPTLRVEEVHFAFDRPTPVRTILAGVPEARELCRQGCDVSVGSLAGEPHVIVFSATPGSGPSEAIEFEWHAADDDAEHSVISLDDDATEANLHDHKYDLTLFSEDAGLKKIGEWRTP